ncbi:MAG: leucine-rich repeat protein, partial [Prevotella sp.]
MKVKHYFLFMIVFGMNLSLPAQTRSEKQAKEIACKYLTEKQGDVCYLPQLKRVTTEDSNNSTDSPYYLFSDRETGSMVIVSGDERMPAIIGDTKEFDDNNSMPMAMVNMLSCYAHQYKELQSGNAQPVIQKSARISTNEKLLQTANWGQEGIFAKYAPEGKDISSSGTAMAIVMKYYQWPAQSSGKASYMLNDEWITEDISGSVYNWNDMPDDFTEGTYTEEQADAVARVIYDAARSAGCYFLNSYSYTYIRNIHGALVNNFDYSTTMLDDWSTIKNKITEDDIRAEIDSGRPVICNAYYTGYYTTQESFVIDGYKNGLFHINFCMGGNYNGYYSLDYLYIEEEKMSLNGSHYKLVGIQPNKSGVHYSPFIYNHNNDYSHIMMSCTDVKTGEKFGVFVSYMQCYQNFYGAIRAALFSSDGSMRELYDGEYIINGYSSTNYYVIDCMPTMDAEEGDYIALVSRAEDESEWKVIRGQGYDELWRIPAVGYTINPVSLNHNIAESLHIKATPSTYITSDGMPLVNFGYTFTLTPDAEVALHDIKLIYSNDIRSLQATAMENGVYTYFFRSSSPEPCILKGSAFNNSQIVDNLTISAENGQSIQAQLETQGIDGATVVGLTLAGDINDIEYINNMPNIKRLDMKAFTSSTSIMHIYINHLSFLEEFVFPAYTIQVMELSNSLVGMKKITLPESSKYGIVRDDLMTSSVTDLYAPITSFYPVAENAFDGADYENCVLHVPTGMKETFAEHSAFGKFKNIVDDINDCTVIFTIDNVTYCTNKDKETVSVTSSSSGSYSGDIVIPESVTYNDVTYPVTNIQSDIFKFSDITTISIPSTIKELESGTFTYCYKLTKAVLPNNMTTIPNEFFLNCTALNDVNFPDSLRRIESAAFYKTAITSINLPDSIYYIADYAFMACNKVGDIHLPSALETVGERAFLTNSSSAHVDSGILPKGLKSVGPLAFMFLYKWGNDNKLVIPKSLQTLGDGALANTMLKEVTVEEGNTSFYVKDHMLFDSKKMALAYIDYTFSGDLIVPEDIKLVGAGCGFLNNKI